jgi:hypothetical protein
MNTEKLCYSTYTEGCSPSEIFDEYIYDLIKKKKIKEDFEWPGRKDILDNECFNSTLNISSSYSSSFSFTSSSSSSSSLYIPYTPFSSSLSSLFESSASSLSSLKIIERMVLQNSYSDVYFDLFNYENPSDSFIEKGSLLPLFKILPLFIHPSPKNIQNLTSSYSFLPSNNGNILNNKNNTVEMNLLSGGDSLLKSSSINKSFFFREVENLSITSLQVLLIN